MFGKCSRRKKRQPAVALDLPFSLRGTFPPEGGVVSNESQLGQEVGRRRSSDRARRVAGIRSTNHDRRRQAQGESEDATIGSGVGAPDEYHRQGKDRSRYRRGWSCEDIAGGRRPSGPGAVVFGRGEGLEV